MGVGLDLTINDAGPILQAVRLFASALFFAPGGSDTLLRSEQRREHRASFSLKGS